MAYSYGQVEITLGSAQSFTTTGDKLTWGGQTIPWYVRRVAIAITTAPTVQTGIINFTTRGTVGSNAGIVAGDIAILNLLTTYIAGQVIYKDPQEKLLKPGQEMVVNVGQNPTAGAGNVNILVEPSYETPLNNTNMVLTT